MPGRSGRNRPYRRVAVCVDKATAYGRGVLRGIADFVDSYGPWSLHLEIHATGVYASDWLHRWRGDGVLAYVESPALARRLGRSRIPVVDVLGNCLDLPIPQVASDEEAFGRLAAEHLLADEALLDVLTLARPQPLVDPVKARNQKGK